MSALKVHALQANLAWHDPAANREYFQSQIDALTATDLIVLPEMFTTGFTMDARGQAETMDGESVQWMTAMARKSGATLSGSLVIEERGRYYNRFLLVRPDGSRVAYDKRHLFRLAGEDGHYTAGRALVTATLGDWRLRPLICYDLRFPVWSRHSADNQFQVLLYVANWPSPRHQAWETLLRARAIENQCYVIGVNRCGRDGNDVPYSGGTAIIDYLGNELAALGNEPGTASAILDMDALVTFRQRFPFHDDADSFSLDTSD